MKGTFSSEEVLLCLEIQRKDIRAGSAIIVGFTMVHQIRAVPKTQLLSRSETNGTWEVFPYDLRGIWIISLNFVFECPPANLSIRISSVEFINKRKWNETLRGFYCLKIQEMVTNKFTKRHWVKWSERQFLSRKVLYLQIQCKDISAGCAIIVPFVFAHQILAVPKTQLLLRSETNGSREVFPYDLRGIWVIPLNFVFLTVHHYFGH